MPEYQKDRYVLSCMSQQPGTWWELFLFCLSAFRRSAAAMPVMPVVPMALCVIIRVFCQENNRRNPGYQKGKCSSDQR